MRQDMLWPVSYSWRSSFESWASISAPMKNCFLCLRIWGYWNLNLMHRRPLSRTVAGNLVAESSLWLGQPPPPELQVLTSCYRLTRVSLAQLEMPSFYSGKSATALRDKTSGMCMPWKSQKKPKPSKGLATQPLPTHWQTRQTQQGGELCFLETIKSTWADFQNMPEEITIVFIEEVKLHVHEWLWCRVQQSLASTKRALVICFAHAERHKGGEKEQRRRQHTSKRKIKNTA